MTPKIERLKYLNLEVNIGKVINTKDNNSVRCRLNNLEEHSWHTSHSQLNLIVDLLYNFYITWGKRQDDLELKLEKLYKEHNQVLEQYYLIKDHILLLLQSSKEEKSEQIKINQNIDYIKEEISVLLQYKGNFPIKEEIINPLQIKKLDQETQQIKSLLQELRNLVVS